MQIFLEVYAFVLDLLECVQWLFRCSEQHVKEDNQAHKGRRHHEGERAETADSGLAFTA